MGCGISQSTERDLIYRTNSGTIPLSDMTEHLFSLAFLFTLLTVASH